MPEPNHEYLYYQTLLGAWPLDADPADAAGMGALAERIDAFMQKAVREGKERSSWGNPDEVYERALSQFVRRTLEVSSTNRFPGEFAGFVDRVARWGAINSLGQTLLKLTIPGMPDTYRGSELWDLSLVDPDNRRPVDYAVRARLLEELNRLFGDDDTTEHRRRALAELVEHWRDGREKLFLIRSVLHLRNRCPALFATGEYVPIAVAGPAADHLCAFARQHGESRAVILVPRFMAVLAGRAPLRPWADTSVALPPGRYRDLFRAEAVACSGAAVPVEALLKGFPVALLLSE
jgi:(1->4)-alpha-D-glucan 1-alpha-D-glucosylmutase